jgi:N-acetylmuramoyl-L-alanine amidase
MSKRILSLLTVLFILLLGCSSFAEEVQKEKDRTVKSKKTAAAAVKKKKTAAGKNRKKAGSAKAVAVAPAKPLPGPAQLSEVRHWSTPDYTRVAVTLSHETPFEQHEIAKTPGSSQLSRIYFDITGARLTPGVKDLSIGDGLLKTARLAQYKADTVRVVLDVENIKDYKIFTFSDPFRIIIDVKGERRAEISALTPVIAAAPPTAEPVTGEAVRAIQAEIQAELPKEPVLVKTAPRKPMKPGKIRRIVVDPGHGGKDPGAVGQKGLQEKDVVLPIGLALAKKLKDELGIDAVMTRSTDVFIELQERTAIANQVGADLFVSIHANASLNRSASGIETYYLNLAKTEKAAQLAARENGTSLEKVSLLQAVLFDLMANYKLNDSAHLAEEVQKALYRRLADRYPPAKNLGVKQGPFYVLVGATMPSILVESAFISNDKEEIRLADPQYQEQIAEGILEGIIAYIAALK